MKIKLKKMSHQRIIKMESGGDIKEVLIHTDFENPEKGKISLCFRGNKQSGIVELSEKEINDIIKTISKMDLNRHIKIFKDQNN